ncbi:MAG: hypothetical protein J2P46_20950 [Zavarzinella sp.]|nr:hypothetical protein [Zavarzinella sp.]
MDPFLADVDVAAKAGRYVVYALAVAGGFLVGNVVTLVLCRLAAKAMFKKRLPVPLERALRVIGGILLAALVAWLLFRFGAGWGLGGTGTGEGEGAGGSTPNETRGGAEGRPKVEPKPKDLETIVSPVVRVSIEKATDYPRTFRFEGDAEALDLAAAKKRLDEISKTTKGEPQLRLKVFQNSTEAGHPDVRDLMDHAHALRFSTRVEKVGERLP